MEQQKNKAGSGFDIRDCLLHDNIFWTSRYTHWLTCRFTLRHCWPCHCDSGTKRGSMRSEYGNSYIGDYRYSNIWLEDYSLCLRNR